MKRISPYDMSYVYEGIAARRRISDADFMEMYNDDMASIFHGRRKIHWLIESHMRTSRCRTNLGLDCPICNNYLDALRALFEYKYEMGARCDRIQHEVRFR